MLAFRTRFLKVWPALFAALLVAAGFLTGVPEGQDLNAPNKPVQTKVMKVYGTSNSCILQGGCTDGAFVYLLFTDGASSGARDRLLKIDLAAQSVEQMSEPLEVDHGNDMTYNAKTGKLVVTHNAPNGKVLSFIDPKTLAVTKTKKIPDKVYGIAYDTLEDRYFLGLSGTYDFARYSAGLQREEVFAGRNNGATRQGIEVYGDSVYFLYSSPNRIVKYTCGGAFVGTYSLPVTKGEPECLFFIHDTPYICYGTGGGSAVIYRLQSETSQEKTGTSKEELP